MNDLEQDRMLRVFFAEARAVEPSQSQVAAVIARAEGISDVSARRLRPRTWPRIPFSTLGGVLAAGTAVGIAVLAIALLGSARVTHVPASGGRATAASGSGRLPVGPYAALRVAGPLAVGPHGELFVADTASHRVLLRLHDGRFRIVAGNGIDGSEGDGGQAVRAELSDITDLAASPDGRLYIAAGGRVRQVGLDGVIRTVAGNGGPQTHISSGMSALSAGLGRSVSIALSENGTLYLSTGDQLLRLDAGELSVLTASVPSGVFAGPLRGFGPIAVDNHGNVVVSGYGGWSIWQVNRSGRASLVPPAQAARQSGGSDSVLQRGPDGAIYAENGPFILRVTTKGLERKLAFTRKVAGEWFWPTHFAFAPDGTLYLDELPGGVGFEARQQLVAIAGAHVMLLWEQPSSR